MKRALALTMAIVMTTQLAVGSMAATPEATTETTYTDVANHWAEAQITEWSDWGILSGSKGQFRPNDAITRGELAVVLDKVMDYQEITENNFTDLQDGKFYTEPVLKLNAAEIMMGDGATVRATDKITRQEASIMITKALSLDLIEGNTTFADDAEISTWAMTYVATLADAGFVGGKGDNKFAPQADITRAEVVAILDNSITELHNTATVLKDDVTGILVMNTADASLEDMKITGDLIIAEGVAEGDVTLKNVEVTGNISILGGGANSVTLEDVTVGGKITAAKEDLRVVFEGTTTASEVVVTAATELDLSKDVEIGTVTAGAELTVSGSGTIKEMILNAGAEKVVLAKGITVETVEANTDTAITGTGKIITLKANVDGITTTMKPKNIETAEGVEKPKTGSGTSSGGGGGGGSSGGDEGEAIETIVNSAPEFNKAVADMKGGGTVIVAADIDYNINATYTGSKKLTIDFAEFTAADVYITADDAKILEINGDATIENLTIDAAKATVTNNVDVTGAITIKAVSETSFDSNADVGTLIMAGKGKLNVAKGSKIAEVKITTSEPVIMSGSILAVTVDHPKANITVREIVESGFTVTGNANSITVDTVKPVTVTGAVNTVAVTAEDAKVVATVTATIATVEIAKEAAGTTLSGKGGITAVTAKAPVALEINVATVTVPEDATKDVKITLAEDVKVATIETAKSVEIAGSGIVDVVDVTADAVKIQVAVGSKVAEITVGDTVTTKPEVQKPSEDGTFVKDEEATNAVKVKLARPEVTLIPNETEVENGAEVSFTIAAKTDVEYLYTTEDEETPTTQYTEETEIDAPDTEEAATIVLRVIAVATGGNTALTSSEAVITIHYEISLDEAKEAKEAELDALEESVSEDDYTDASWTKFADAVEADEEAIDDCETVADVEAYVLTAIAARGNLVEVDSIAPTITVEKADAFVMNTKANEWTAPAAKAIDNVDIITVTVAYSSTDKDSAVTNIETARKHLATAKNTVTVTYTAEDTTGNDADEVVLVFTSVSDPVEALKMVKTAKIATVDALLVGLTKTDYTVETWKVFELAMTADKAAINACTTTATVEAYVLTAIAAKEALVVVPTNYYDVAMIITAGAEVIPVRNLGNVASDKLYNDAIKDMFNVTRLQSLADMMAEEFTPQQLELVDDALSDTKLAVEKFVRASNVLTKDDKDDLIEELVKSVDINKYFDTEASKVIAEDDAGEHLFELMDDYFELLAGDEKMMPAEGSTEADLIMFLVELFAISTADLVATGILDSVDYKAIEMKNVVTLLRANPTVEQAYDSTILENITMKIVFNGGKTLTLKTEMTRYSK